MKRKKKTLAERKRQERLTTADKPANPSFRNFTVRRTIEIHLTTINPQLTQRDAEFYVDGNFYVRGQLDGKYQDFYLTRVKMNYNNRKNSTDNGKDKKQEAHHQVLVQLITWIEGTSTEVLLPDFTKHS